MKFLSLFSLLLIAVSFTANSDAKINVDYFAYEVKKGDTYESIAEKKNLHLEDLKAANPKITVLYPKQIIRLPEPLRHIWDETLSELAQKFDYSLEDLKAANPRIQNPDSIPRGETIYKPPVRKTYT